jgi:hypothetical protein
MERHGSESYYVIGEGLLGESVGGREPTLARAVEATAPPFRFSRMGPGGRNRQLTDTTLKALGKAMTIGGGGQSQIPAGFTYLGQFIDHDLTFDRTEVTFGDHVSPAELLQARSPSLDLDSLYGAGPTDPESAKFYEADGIHLKMGKTRAFEGEVARDGFDLPRGAGTTQAQKRKAIIPDPRNDENLAVAQTHLAMIRFHNRVVDTLPASVAPSQRFARARRVVTRHYQWMIRNDFLPRICAPGVVNDVFTNGRKAFEVGLPATDVPTMPIEFSVAAYRLGHSMVRRAYNWNRIFDFGFGTLDLLFHFTALSVEISTVACGSRAPGSRISAASTTSQRQGATTSRCRRRSSTARCASTRGSPTRCGPCPASPTRTTSPSAISRGRRWCAWPRGSKWRPSCGAKVSR